VTQRDRTVMMVVAAVALIGAYWFLLLSPRRNDASSVKAEVTKAQQALTAAESSLAASRKARLTYGVNYTSVARLGKAVPTDDDVDTLVFQLDSAAKASHSDFRKIALSTDAVTPAATGVASAVAATQNTSSTGATGASGATGTSGAAGATGASGASAAVAATQSETAGLPPGAAVGPAGLLTMPFTFQFTGSFFHLADFLNRVQHFTIPDARQRLQTSGRLITIDGIAMSGFPSSTVEIAANTFLLPPDQGLFNGATPAAPAPSGTQTVSDGSGSGGGTPAVAATATGVAG
jgi:hypothetical protein